MLGWLKQIPVHWWAICVGVFFGSVALITVTAERDGYGKATLTAIGLAPFLCLLAGALLPAGTSLEMAALAGGMAALGGTAMIMGLSKKAPRIFGAAADAAARSWLEVGPSQKGEATPVTRIHADGTPDPDPELNELAKRLDGDEI